MYNREHILFIPGTITPVSLLINSYTLSIIPQSYLSQTCSLLTQVTCHHSSVTLLSLLTNSCTLSIIPQSFTPLSLLTYSCYMPIIQQSYLSQTCVTPHSCHMPIIPQSFLTHSYVNSLLLLTSVRCQSYLSHTSAFLGHTFFTPESFLCLTSCNTSFIPLSHLLKKTSFIP